MPENNSNKIEWNVWGFVIFAGILLLAGIALTIYDGSETSTHIDWESPGIRGDFYGGHLAAASALAGTLLLFSAVLMQRNELKLQRIELSESRKVAAEQARALERQVEELQKQNKIVRRRNDCELIISLVDKTKNFTVESEAKALCRLTLAQIVDCASFDQNMAHDLLTVFVLTVRGVVLEKSYIEEELKQAVYNYVPELEESTENVFKRKWLEHAITTIHCA